jgi:hypothetical protein
MREKRNTYKTLTRKLKGCDHLEDLDIGGRIIISTGIIRNRATNRA